MTREKKKKNLDVVYKGYDLYIGAWSRNKLYNRVCGILFFYLCITMVMLNANGELDR